MENKYISLDICLNTGFEGMYNGVYIFPNNKKEDNARITPGKLLGPIRSTRILTVDERGAKNFINVAVEVFGKEILHGSSNK